MASCSWHLATRHYYLPSAYLRPGALQLRLVAAPVVDHVVRKLLEARLRQVTRINGYRLGAYGDRL